MSPALNEDNRDMTIWALQEWPFRVLYTLAEMYYIAWSLIKHRRPPPTYDRYPQFTSNNNRNSKDGAQSHRQIYCNQPHSCCSKISYGLYVLFFFDYIFSRFIGDILYSQYPTNILN
ncbi:hypothetical protein GALMADRAFT_252841 [Galerina marginata CBS 339.88]|uniref:Uncharacterized protein n=1 Tax=Galerina marginata (strain CBS 339.88) TaxID=685588 RepID=A0A067SY98_GALM3|nr:hypothetical protein GALMADRAFT_252841 [Galerina marginata CBS 339.88]